MAGVELERVTQIIAESGGERWRGSGYEIAAGTVVTAAHVVARARAVQVRFTADEAGERVVAAAITFAHPRADVAILSFSPDHPDELRARAEFGRIRQQATGIGCVAVGFPLFKLREYPREPDQLGQPASRFRDSHQANGTVAPLSNVRDGTLEFQVAAPGPDTETDHSPWEGMSGAALWCGSRIVGLISAHHRREGLGRLAATRVSQWYLLLNSDELRRLSELTGIPPQLPDLAVIGESDFADVADPAGPRAVINADVSYQDTTIIAGRFTGRDSYGDSSPQRRNGP